MRHPNLFPAFVCADRLRYFVFCGLGSFFLADVLACDFKITTTTPFDLVKIFSENMFLALLYSLVLIISLILFSVGCSSC